MENITIIINYKSLKDLILVIIIDYNCQKIIIIIRYNRLFTPKLGCGLSLSIRLEKNISNKYETRENIPKSEGKDSTLNVYKKQENLVNKKKKK